MALIDEQYLTDIAHFRDVKRAPRGDIDKISGVANVQEALLRRLMTQPGSLIHRPDYGVGIKDFQDAVFTIDNQRILAARVTEQFEKDFRVDEVRSMSVAQDRNIPEQVIIYVKVRLRGLGEETLRFRPFGEEGV